MKDKNLNVDSGRNVWLDVAKGITIILMVIGHTSIPKSISHFIWAFHMPLFFIASGWTSNWDKYCIKNFIAHKTKAILFPFLVYSIVVLCIERYTMGIDFGEWIKQGWGGYALWFVPILFISSLICKFIYCIETKYLRYIFILGILILGCYFRCCAISLPWTLTSVPYASFLVFLGSELRFLSNYIGYTRWWHILVSAVFVVIISHYYQLDLASNYISPVIPITIGAIMGTSMVFIISSYIVNSTHLLSHIFQVIGKETFVVVAFSQITIMLLNKYLTLNVGMKYMILLIALIMIAMIKNGINRLVNKKLL